MIISLSLSLRWDSWRVSDSELIPNYAVSGRLGIIWQNNCIAICRDSCRMCNEEKEASDAVNAHNYEMLTVLKDFYVLPLYIKILILWKRNWGHYEIWFLKLLFLLIVAFVKVRRYVGTQLPTIDFSTIKFVQQSGRVTKGKCLCLNINVEWLLKFLKACEKMS